MTNSDLDVSETSVYDISVLDGPLPLPFTRCLTRLAEQRVIVPNRRRHDPVRDGVDRNTLAQDRTRIFARRTDLGECSEQSTSRRGASTACGPLATSGRRRHTKRWGRCGELLDRCNKRLRPPCLAVRFGLPGGPSCARLPRVLRSAQFLGATSCCPSVQRHGAYVPTEAWLHLPSSHSQATASPPPSSSLRTW
mgnify:CR=1 FL=1